MADNSDYYKDPRTPCKYGSRCYRTNKVHLEKFKHPPGTCKDDTEVSERPNKKQKTDADSVTTEIPIGILKTKDQSLSPNKNKFNEKINSLSPKKNKNDGLSPKKSPAGNNMAKENDKSSVECTSLKDKIRSTESKKLELKSDSKQIIKQLFLVDMPDDFYSFWKMCETLSKSDPTNALKDIKLKLVGPFDVLAGKVTEVFEEDLPDFLRHWRYYYDPPEFQTVLASTDSRCFHMGYYRDNPNEMPVFVASNALNTKHPEKNGEIKVMGPNLFSALNAYLEELKTDPFSRMRIPKFQKVLTNWAKEKGFSLEKSSKQMESRGRKVVAKTFHGAGIVVPVDTKNDVGYRELAASNATIKKILKGIVESKSDEERKTFWEQLQPVMTFANIANDECDFGTSLELGLDLFSYGSCLLHRSILQLLPTAYNLLQRPQFAAIIEVFKLTQEEIQNVAFDYNTTVWTQIDNLKG